MSPDDHRQVTISETEVKRYNQHGRLHAQAAGDAYGLEARMTSVPFSRNIRRKSSGAPVSVMKTWT